MLRYKVHQLHVRGRYYLLLPKLNSAQMKMLADRLAKLGYHVGLDKGLAARARGKSIYLNPLGFCRSSFYPSDAIYPAIPDILAAEKEPLPLEALERLYFGLKVSRGGTLVRVSTRIESSTNWDALRSSGECGLTPDERVVSSYFLNRAEGACELLTDFLCERSVPRICGRRRYFDSLLDVAQAACTLRAVGGKESRNSYLPRGGVLRLRGKISLSGEEMVRLLDTIGEWCYLALA